MSADEPQEPLARLDPEAAAPRGPAAEPLRGRVPGEPTFSPRRYQWLAGLFGIALLAGFSIVQLTSHGVGTAGIPAGRALTPFAAPLATSSLVGDANLNPPCTAARHDPRALNTCLIMARGPLVLDFFVTGSSSCERSVTAMQALVGRFAGAGVQFAAVAVRSGPAAARAAVRRNRWTIPVAYDRDGAVAQSDGVVVCPLLELVRRGGIVERRLIGKAWSDPARLAGAVRALSGG